MPQYDTPIYFPLGHGERASHLKVNQLLARPVYERLAEMLNESLPDEGSVSDSRLEEERFIRGRGHSTIFLDGDRGTGKTTVIVNLRQYLESPEVTANFAGLADAVHIFRPIDPSQLEDGDNLFLDVIVAAVLGDKDVNAERERKPQEWQALHASLQKLGSALQGRETQGVGFGLDKLRAFMGSQELAGAVHDFFYRPRCCSESVFSSCRSTTSTRRCIAHSRTSRSYAAISQARYSCQLSAATCAFTKR